MPIAIARKIQRARKRSRRPRDLKAETLAALGWDCFSGSDSEGEVMGSSGSALGRMGTGWVVSSSMLMDLGLVDSAWGNVYGREMLLRWRCCI